MANAECVLRIISHDLRKLPSVGILPRRFEGGYSLPLLSRLKSPIPANAGLSFFSAKSAYPLEFVIHEVSIRLAWVTCPLFFLNLIESGF